MSIQIVTVPDMEEGFRQESLAFPSARTGSLSDLDAGDLGRRLRLARERVGFTQAQAADEIGIARTTLVAVESGQRRVRMEELRALARSYGESVNALTRPEALHVDLLPRFGRAAGKGPAACQAAETLANLVAAEVELERVLDVTRVRSYPPERPLLPGDVRAQAESDAADMRHRLGIGMAPIRDIVSLLEIDLGMRVYIRPLDAGVSGAFAYDDAVGACVLLNANHPRERRAQTAAHELGRFVSCRRTADVMFDGRPKSSEKRYADAFARAFLTPARTVMERFTELTRGSGTLTRRHVILMAHIFGVSREALVRRLEDLRQVKRGAWDWFQANGGIANQQASKVLNDLVPEDLDRAGAMQPGTLRLNLLAAEAYRQDLLSEGQLARLLRLDRIELREILDSVDAERDVDGLPQLSR